MRCAVCGSKRVTKETKKEGYNTKKGIIGLALFGISGAIIGGAKGNDVIYYHCADCGNVLNQPMDSTTQMTINIHMEHPEMFEKELKEEKERYPNIEWTPVEKEVSKKTDEELILETMFEIGRPVTVSEIVEHKKIVEKNSNEFSSRSRITAMLLQMMNDNKVKREQIDKKFYFSLI